MRIKKSVSWQKLGDGAVILNPSKELLIGLTPKGWEIWQMVILNRNNVSIDENSKVFIRDLKKLGIFDDVAYVERSTTIDPTFIDWIEIYKPLAFTRSCGLYPAGGGPCQGHPFH